ncbi:hypothetical protein ACS0TY_008315 [Phlomoides rotata]
MVGMFIHLFLQLPLWLEQLNNGEQLSSACVITYSFWICYLLYIYITESPSMLNKSKASQLTIFYCGTVNVFDDISPEKAQAIMLLAGNAYVQSNMTQSKLHMQTPAPKHPAADQALVSCMNTPGLLSPVSVSSHPADQSSANNDDVKARKASLAQFLEKRKER